MEGIHQNSIQELENLRERVFRAGIANHNPELLVIADDILKIKNMFLEEEKKELLGKKQSLQGGIVVSDNIEDLDRGHEDTLNVR